MLGRRADSREVCRAGWQVALAALAGALTAIPLSLWGQSSNVDIFNGGFAPSSMAVPKGATVTWIVTDGTHTVASDAFQSSTLEVGETFSVTFNVTGRYRYHCTIHPSMMGTVTVGAPHDLDGSARSDILWRNSAGTIAAWLMRGAEVLVAAVVAQVPPNWTIIGQRDFSGDGKHDLIWRNGLTGDVALWSMDGATVAGGSGLGT